MQTLRCSCLLRHRTVNGTINRTIVRSFSHSINHSINRTITRPNSRTSSRSISQITNQSINQRIRTFHISSLQPSSNNKSNNQANNQPDSQTSNENTFYITTPIFYVNGPPHIGHLYTALLADARARVERLKQPQSQTNLSDNQSSKRVFLATGTDEHGTKVKQAAAAANLPVQQFTDQVSDRYRKLFESIDCSFDTFIRTTDNKHKAAVQSFFSALSDSGDVYRGKHEGWYCTADEAFVPEQSVVQTTEGDKTIVRSADGHVLEWQSEENYMFRLSSYRDRLLEWLQREQPIQPIERYNEVVSFLSSNQLNDLSVSRAIKRNDWGIQVPNDETQTVYVWLDALVNYLTIAGYPFNQSNNQSLWPASVHLIGKDIVRFHCVYWPAFLMSVGLPLPKSIVVHSHWTVEGRKMSKSLGNVIDPVKLIEQLTHAFAQSNKVTNDEITQMNQRCAVDCLRYFLLYQSHSLVDDSDFSMNELVKRYGDLSDVFGNLLSRLTAPAFQSILDQPVNILHPSTLSPQDHEMIAMMCMLRSDVVNAYDQFAFGRGCEEVMKMLRNINQYISQREPWKMIKQLDQPDLSEKPLKQVSTQLKNTLYIGLEAVRVAAVLLQPVMPQSSKQVLDRLQVGEHERDFDSAVFGRKRGPLNAGNSNLFTRLDIQKANNPKNVKNVKSSKQKQRKEQITDS